MVISYQRRVPEFPETSYIIIIFIYHIHAKSKWFDTREAASGLIRAKQNGSVRNNEIVRSTQYGVRSAEFKIVVLWIFNCSHMAANG